MKEIDILHDIFEQMRDRELIEEASSIALYVFNEAKYVITFSFDKNGELTNVKVSQG